MRTQAKQFEWWWWWWWRREGRGEEGGRANHNRGKEEKTTGEGRIHVFANNCLGSTGWAFTSMYAQTSTTQAAVCKDAPGVHVLRDVYPVPVWTPNTRHIFTSTRRRKKSSVSHWNRPTVQWRHDWSRACTKKRQSTPGNMKQATNRMFFNKFLRAAREVRREHPTGREARTRMHSAERQQQGTVENC